MLTIKISTESGRPSLRQTPGSTGVWGDCRFILNEPVVEADYWVVYDRLETPENLCCPPENTILITDEPPSIKSYPPCFLAQFATVISCQRNLKHPRVINAVQAHPWLVQKSYDELVALNNFSKSKLISTVCSDKSFTPGHYNRLNFLKHLLTSNIKINIFGRNINYITDKWDAIADYQYHLVLENSVYPDYWTEKLADAFLGGAFPIYCGCPNINDYFPIGSLATIDLTDYTAATRQINSIINNCTYQQSRENIKAARQLILNHYNLFPMLARFCTENYQPRTKKLVYLQSETNF